MPNNIFIAYEKCGFVLASAVSTFRVSSSSLFIAKNRRIHITQNAFHSKFRKNHTSTDTTYVLGIVENNFEGYL